MDNGLPHFRNMEPRFEGRDTILSENRKDHHVAVLNLSRGRIFPRTPLDNGYGSRLKPTPLTTAWTGPEPLTARQTTARLPSCEIIYEHAVFNRHLFKSLLLFNLQCGYRVAIISDFVHAASETVGARHIDLRSKPSTFTVRATP